MARISTIELRRYLLRGQLYGQGCLRSSQSSLPPLPRKIPSLGAAQHVHLAGRHHSTAASSHKDASPAAPPADGPPVPLRKQLKAQYKAARRDKKTKDKTDNQTVPGWELTVGIEIHAQLNTPRKLFSPAVASTFNDTPNTHVALFDVAMPGSQPDFQKESLIPAVRAALALGCDIQKISRFDRKHYFHWDQPAGYQITQYYEPFARDGKIVLYDRDGIAAQDGERVEVAVKQVQMEQDTAKTTAQPGGVQWLDFNRVGVPLIEIITEPEIHHPATAAALVRKIQLLLGAVDACVLGMEAGGLRADVNVSVRRSGDPAAPLGTRTEIKNLSSFKAVQDAIIAERDRQIAVLETGGAVEGETRGWSLGSTETRRLRGKEGEVDYRYMPDPDLGPVVIGDDLVQHLRASMGALPDAEADDLMRTCGLSAKDALSLMLLDGGGRVQYFYSVLEALDARLQQDRAAGEASEPLLSNEMSRESISRSRANLAANWCLHELGKLTAAPGGSRPEAEVEDDGLQITRTGSCRIAADDLADILSYLHQRRITANVARDLLWAVFRREVGSGSDPFVSVEGAVDRDGLWFRELSDDEYAQIADGAVQGEDKVLGEFQRFRDGKSRAYPQGKLMFLVGKMMRQGPEGRMDPKSAEGIMRERISGKYLAELDERS